MHSTNIRSMPAKTSDEIKTMCNARTSWSMPRTLSGLVRRKDDKRLRRNEAARKCRKLRRENIALRRRTREINNLLRIEVE